VQAWQAGVGGVPAREMDELAKAMGGGGVSKGRVSELWQAPGARVGEFPGGPWRVAGPACGRATYLGAGGRAASVAATIALGANAGFSVRASGCRRPRSSGPSSCAAWRAHGAEGGRRPSARPGLESARAHGRQMAGPLRARFPKAAALTDGSGDGVLARRRGRRLPQRGRRLAGAALMGQNDGWMQGKRHMALEAMAEAGGAPELPPALPAWPRTTRPENIYTTLTDATVAPALERREQGGEGTAQRGSSSKRVAIFCET